MPIQYTAPGFEPTTFGHESPPITTRPGRLPMGLFYVCVSFSLKRSLAKSRWLASCRCRIHKETVTSLNLKLEFFEFRIDNNSSLGRMEPLMHMIGQEKNVIRYT